MSNYIIQLEYIIEWYPKELQIMEATPETPDQ